MKLGSPPFKIDFGHHAGKAHFDYFHLTTPPETIAIPWCGSKGLNHCINLLIQPSVESNTPKYLNSFETQVDPEHGVSNLSLYLCVLNVRKTFKQNVEAPQ